MDPRELDRMMSLLGITPHDMKRMMADKFPTGSSLNMPARSSTNKGGDKNAEFRAAMEREISAIRRQTEVDRGLGPGPAPPPVHRATFINHMIQSREDMDDMIGQSGQFYRTYVGHERHYSSTPLSKLKQSEPEYHIEWLSLTYAILVAFSDMQVRKVHKVQDTWARYVFLLTLDLLLGLLCTLSPSNPSL